VGIHRIVGYAFIAEWPDLFIQVARNQPVKRGLFPLQQIPPATGGQHGMRAPVRHVKRGEDPIQTEGLAIVPGRQQLAHPVAMVDHIVVDIHVVGRCGIFPDDLRVDILLPQIGAFVFGAVDQSHPTIPFCHRLQKMLEVGAG